MSAQLEPQAVAGGRKGVPAATARMARGKRGSTAALSSPAAAASTDALSGLMVAARCRRSSSPARAAAGAAGVSTSMKPKP